MKRIALLVMMTTALFFVTGNATAQIDAENAPGEVHINLSLAYAKVLVNGEEWDNTDFINNGKTLIVRGIDRNATQEFTVEASEEGFAPVTFRIEGKKKYKKKRKKRVISFVAKQNIRFKKVGEKPETRAQKAPAASEDASPKNNTTRAGKAKELDTDKASRKAKASKVRAPKER
jgi:hypothetical protein